MCLIFDSQWNPWKGGFYYRSSHSIIKCSNFYKPKSSDMLQFVQRSFRWGILIVVLSGLSGCRETEKELKIIPKPASQKILKGKFILGLETRIIPERNDLRQSAGYLQDFIREKY